MPSNWIDNSEIVAGLILQERIKSIPSPEIFHPEFQEVIKDIKDGATKEELIKRHKIGKINAAHNRANDLNGLGDNVDWLDILEHSSEQWSRAEYFEQSANQLKQGNDPDYAPLREIFDDESKSRKGVIPASEIEAAEVDLVPCGFAPFDAWMGGVADAGTTLFLGHPKSGKTMLGTILSLGMLEQYKDKTGIYITTEMMNSQMVSRAEFSGMTDNLDRWLIFEQEKGVEDIYNTCEKVGKGTFSHIVVDLVDELVIGEISEPKISHVHRTVAQIGRKYRVPVLAFGQATIRGRTIRPKDAYWSQTAAARSASMVCSIYNPAKPYAPRNENDIKPIINRKDVCWIYSWICRGRLTPLMNEHDELEKRYPFAMPVLCSTKKWWNTDDWKARKRIAKLPTSIASLENSGF